MYTLVEIGPRIAKENPSRHQEPIVRSFPRGSLGGFLVAGYQGYRKGVLVGGTVYHTGIRGFQIVGGAERLKRSARGVLYVRVLQMRENGHLTSGLAPVQSSIGLGLVR